MDIVIVIILMLIVLAFFKKSYFGASPYTEVTVKISIKPPEYTGVFTNYAAWVTNIDPAVGCPPPLAYGKPLPALTAKQVPYFAPSSVTCSLGAAAAKTCTGKISGEDTLILTFTGDTTKNLLPNQVYAVYLYINNPAPLAKQNYTCICIKLNDVPLGSPLVASVVNSVLVAPPATIKGRSIMADGANFAGGYHSGANSILATGYLSWTPYDIYGGKIPIANITMTTPNKHVIVFSAYLVSGTNMSVSIGGVTIVVNTAAYVSTYVVTIQGPATGTSTIDVAASSTDSPMAVVAIKLLDVFYY